MLALSACVLTLLLSIPTSALDIQADGAAFMADSEFDTDAGDGAWNELAVFGDASGTGLPKFEMASGPESLSATVPPVTSTGRVVIASNRH